MREGWLIGTTESIFEMLSYDTMVSKVMYWKPNDMVATNEGMLPAVDWSTGTDGMIKLWATAGASPATLYNHTYTGSERRKREEERKNNTIGESTVRKHIFHKHYWSGPLQNSADINIHIYYKYIINIIILLILTTHRSGIIRAWINGI